MFLMVYLFIAVIKMEKSETALKSINEIMKVINEKDEKVWADQACIKCKTHKMRIKKIYCCRKNTKKIHFHSRNQMNKDNGSTKSKVPKKLLLLLRNKYPNKIYKCRSIHFLYQTNKVSSKSTKSPKLLFHFPKVFRKSSKN